MSLIAVLLIIISAFMHATWNFISKRQSPSLAFFFITTVAAGIAIAPVLLIYRATLPLIPAEVWALVVATGVAQMIYFLGLAGAYRRGALSLAYPLARAIPVLLVVAVSTALGQGEAITPPGLAGMLLIAAGCVILPLPAFGGLQWRRYADIVVLMAVVAAIGTTGYTVIDDRALSALRLSSAITLSGTAITLLYIALQTISTALMLGIAVLLYPPERRLLRAILGNPALLRSGAATGLIIMATYGLVLAAMAYVTNVSYVAAFRQLSIPIGAVLGITLQGEPRYRPKLLGVAIVSVGLVLVGLG